MTDSIGSPDDRQPDLPPGAGPPAPASGEGRPLPAPGRRPGPESDDRGGLPLVAPDGDGLRWSFELDLVSALEALGRPLRDWDGVDQEVDLAAEAAALELTDVPPDPAGISSEPDLTHGPSGSRPGPGRADLPPGPDLPGAPAGAPPAPAGSGPGRAVAEALPAGPGLAAWLSGQDPATATGHDVVGMEARRAPLVVTDRSDAGGIGRTWIL